MSDHEERAEDGRRERALAKVGPATREEFRPRYWNPSEQDVEEAMWCVRTNEPWTCAHDPECRDVFYAEILRLRTALAATGPCLEHKEAECDACWPAASPLNRRFR